MPDRFAAPPMFGPRRRHLLIWSTVVSAFVLCALYGAQVVDVFVFVVILLPAWGLFVAVVVVLLTRLDPFRTTRTHRRLLVVATLLGGTVAVILATVGDELLDTVWPILMPSETAERWSAALSAPIAEELAKLLCVYVLITAAVRPALRPAHAFVLGAFVGFGFDVVEDFIYTVGAASDAEPGTELTEMATQMAIRMVTVVPGHWIFTGISAVGLLLLLQASAAVRPWRERTIAAGFFAAAWFMHFVWDLPAPDDDTPPQLQVSTPGRWVIDMAVFAALYWYVQRSERRYVQHRITNAASDPTDPLTAVDPEVLASLVSIRARHLLRRRARQNGGRAAAVEVKHVQLATLDMIEATPSPFAAGGPPATPDALPAGGRHRPPTRT